MNKRIFLLSLFAFFSALSWSKEPLPKTIDIIVFSYNRAMQLDVFLDSLYRYCENIGDVVVIYRSSDDFFERGYDKTKLRYPQVSFFKQGKKPRNDFKYYVLDAVYHKTHSEYVMFAVDDTVFKSETNFSEVVNLLEKYQAYAFYLRLGMHFDWCYSAQVPQSLPVYQLVEDNVCSWNLSQGTYEFGYPHDVVTAVYRKAEIRADLRILKYTTPNTFEGEWSFIKPKNDKALCFAISKTLMLPLNKVQEDNNNVTMNALSINHLNEQYLDGYIFNTAFLHDIVNNACCYEYVPSMKKM